MMHNYNEKTNIMVFRKMYITLIMKYGYYIAIAFIFHHQIITPTP